MKTWYVWMVLLFLPHIIKSQGQKPIKLIGKQDQSSLVSNDTLKVPTETPVSDMDNGAALAPATFVQNMVDLINKYRMMHAALPLTISQELTKKASSKAIEMAALDKEQLDVNSKYGQAIFSTSNPNNIARKSVQSWYDQMIMYDFHRAIPSTKAMYFTQLVWVDSKEFGAGKAVASGGKIYIVALFNPPGNKGPFENEVRPVTGSGAGKLGDASCTDNYKFFNNSCFKFFPGLRNWKESSERCSSEFATLTSVNSISEDNFLKTLLTSAGVNDAWIGMSDFIKEGFVTWLDGTAPHFLDWDSFQSSIEGPKCIVINTQNRWRYQRCNTPKGFICRKKLRDIGTYEVTIRFLDKVWSDALLNPSTPRYLSLKHHLEGAILDVYGDDDWFDKFTFDSFRKDKQNLILADFKLEFAPDDNSPTDPLQKLRDAIKASSQGQGAGKKNVVQGSKPNTVSGVLHGLRIELVNVTLVLDESLACPNYCQATQCAPAACSQQCCGQYGQQFPAGGFGGQTLGQQYGYPAMGGNQVPLPQFTQQPFNMQGFYPNSQCQRPPCPPPVPYSSAPCQRPPCPPPVSSLAAPCPRPPCPPPAPTARCPRPPCPPPMQTPPIPCRKPPCPPPVPYSATSCPQPPCPPPVPYSATSCPQPPCPPPVPNTATSCPTPPCPPPVPYSGTSCPQPPCPPPAPQFSQPSCPTPPCLPNQGFQLNTGSAAINQPFGQYRQLPSFRLPSRRQHPFRRLKGKKGAGKKDSDVFQDNKVQPKTPQQPAVETRVPDYKDFFMPSFNDPNNPQSSQSGYTVRMFKPVIELQRPAPQFYGYGNGYQSPQYMYPQTQQYQPYSTYQTYPSYQSNQPHTNYQYGQPYRPYTSYASQSSFPAVPRATPLTVSASERKPDSETKQHKRKHHRYHHGRRMPLTSSYPSPYQAQYYSNPYPNQGQVQMSGMYQPNQQYGSYMNYPPPAQIQQQPQFVQGYGNPMQPQYQDSYSRFYSAPNQVNFIPRQSPVVGGSRGLGPLEPPLQDKVCAAPCPNTCAPECTPTCCRDKKKRQLIVKH